MFFAVFFKKIKVEKSESSPAGPAKNQILCRFFADFIT